MTPTTTVKATTAPEMAQVRARDDLRVVEPWHRFVAISQDNPSADQMFPRSKNFEAPCLNGLANLRFFVASRGL